MSEVIVLATVRPRPGHEEAVEAAFRGLLAPTHAEAGCILYALHRVRERPGELVFVERWASPEALAAHAASDHIAAVGREVGDLLAEPVDVVVLEPLPGGDPRAGALASG